MLAQYRIITDMKNMHSSFFFLFVNINPAKHFIKKKKTQLSIQASQRIGFQKEDGPWKIAFCKICNLYLFQFGMHECIYIWQLKRGTKASCSLDFTLKVFGKPNHCPRRRKISVCWGIKNRLSQQGRYIDANIIFVLHCLKMPYEYLGPNSW